MTKNEQARIWESERPESAMGLVDVAGSPGMQVSALREADRVYRKIAWRIAPIIVTAYILAYIDRVNIGFAKLQFLHDLDFSEAVYGLGAGLFFIGYACFEVPSNLLLERIGARLTISRIMILWGAISAGMAFVETPMQFYVMRFALGAAEAGLFPGAILYLSYWFPSSRRGRMTSLFTMGAPAAGLIGNPISGWLMSAEGLHGLHGWQVLFIYEGAPALLLGLFALFYLDDKPQTSRWLNEQERWIVIADLNADRPSNASGHAGLGQAFRNPILYVLAIAYIGGFSATSTVALWSPTIIKALGFTTTVVGVLGAIPYLLAMLAMYLFARSSDQTLERRWHYGVPIFAAGISLALLGFSVGNSWLTIVLLTIAAAGAAGQVPIFWTIPATLLSGPGKAAGIAFISSVGAMGGFVSPLIVGWAASATGSIYWGLALVGAMIISAAILLLVFVKSDSLNTAPRSG